MTPSFPHYIDNTMRKTLVKCQKAAHYAHELGLRHATEKRVDLVAGGSFARGIEVARRKFYDEGTSVQEAHQAGVEALYGEYGPAVFKDTNKTVDRMAGALLFYLNRFPLETEKLTPVTFRDGTFGIELSFAFPVGINHPDDGKPLYYCGKFDMLARHEDTGEIWVVDEKTTSSMGDKWANQWPLDSQMTGYVWAASQLMNEVDPITRGTVAGAVIGGIAIKKYDYDTGRYPTYREEWQVERWYHQLQRDVKQWIEVYKSGEHNMNLDHSCAYYLNPCQFAPLCRNRNPERLMQGGEYTVEFWSPRAEEQRK